ncbi:hypothetical protein CDD81_5831 [Ophiocordyceps australis]|uniref:Uncharacterized protein n=1 Tax=Ophiocordyceps australis TaxID=1399860 RepID=A0A2C5Y869_9HYPO|nr:hypothetical protein CDD81_5831 [Ophiocordyceps australis]
MVLYSDVQQAIQGFTAFYNRRDFCEDATSSLFLLAWDELSQFHELDPEAPRGRLYCPNSILPTPREIYELRDVYRNMIEFELEESLDDILGRPQPYRPMRVSRTPERTISSMSRARQFVQDVATLVGANCATSREQGPTCDEAAARIPDQELEALIDSALDLERDSSNLDAVVRAEGESCQTRAENIMREAPGLPPAILDVALDLINAQCPNDPDCSAIDFLANSADSSIFESLIESLLETTDDPVCSVEGPTAAKSRKLNDCLHKQFNDDADYAWSAVFEAATVHPSVMRYLCPVNQVTQGAEACLRDAYDYATYNALGAIVDSPPEFYDQVANVLDHTCPSASNPESSNPAQDLQQIRIQEFNDFMDQAPWRFGLPAEELLERIDQGIENLRQYWPDIWTFLRQFPALFNFWLSTPSFSFCLSSGHRKRAYRPGMFNLIFGRSLQLDR